MSEGSIRRPGGITLLVVLGVINGIVAIGAGVFMLLDKDSIELQEEVNMSTNQLQAAGWGLLVIGALTVILSLMLGKGSNIVRWMYGILMMGNVGFGLWGLLSLHGEQQMSAAFSVIFGLMVLWILFGNERTDEFFKI